MATDFVCRNCGTKFSVHEGDKPRCPSCLRVHGVDGGAESDAAASGGDDKTPAASKSGKLGAILAVVVIAAGVGAYFLWKAQRGSSGGGASSSSGKKEELGAASGADKALVVALTRAGIPEDRVIGAVGEGVAIRDKAKALAGKTTPLDQANALWAVGKAWLDAKNLRPGHEELLRKQLVRGAAKAADDLQAGAPGEVFGVELAGALLSIARAAKANAFGYELEQGGGKIRAEAVPQLANVGVALYPAGDAKGKPVVIDVAAGRVAEGTAGRRLDDAQLAAHFYVARAGYFFLRSEGGRANKESEWAVKLDEESPAAAATRGIVLMAFAQIDQAVSQLRRAAERGKAARWNVLLCLGLLRAERGDESTEACKKAVSQDPSQTGTHLALGYAMLAQGDLDKAVESMENARKVDDADAEVHKGLAQVHDAKGDREKAKGHVAQAQRIDPAGRGAHLLTALMAMKDADFDAAAAALVREVDLDPENERLRALLATTYYRAGKKADAEKVIAQMRVRSKDREMTEDLVKQVQLEAVDDDDGDGGLDDLDPDGGAEVVPPLAGGTPPPASTPGGLVAPGGAGGADKDDLDDDKDDDKDEPPGKPGEYELKQPGETQRPSLFDLGKGGQ